MIPTCRCGRPGYGKHDSEEIPSGSRRRDYWYTHQQKDKWYCLPCILDVPLTAISVRSGSAMKRLGVVTFRDLSMITHYDLMMTPHSGKRVLAEMIDVMTDSGLRMFEGPLFVPTAKNNRCVKESCERKRNAVLQPNMAVTGRRFGSLLG